MATFIQYQPMPASREEYNQTHESSRNRAIDQNFTTVANVLGVVNNWQSYTPTITAPSASTFAYTLVHARWSRINRTLFFNVSFTVTAHTGPVSAMVVTLPTTPTFTFSCSGADITNDHIITGYYAPVYGGLELRDYNGSDAISNGHTYIVSGSYESN
jgi:hypothetical protein